MNLSRIDRIRTSRAGAVLFYGYLVAIVLAGMVIGQVVLSNRTAVMQSHRALCGIKTSYEHQLAVAREFLAAHPHGTTDFPRSQIVRAIRADVAQLASLSDITCPKEAP